MPRLKVVERRCYEATYVVEADNEDESVDSYADALLSCEEVDEDYEE